MQNDPIPALERLVKSKQRVNEHGEVFTPSHIVTAMLNLVQDESERIDSRVLEPACGEGNFLKQVLLRKLATVQNKYGNSEFERRHYGLLAMMSVYGIELLADNAALCRSHLLEIFSEFISDQLDSVWIEAGSSVLEANIIQGDALTMKSPDGEALVFPEWGYLGRGKFQRRDFKYAQLTQRSSFTESGTLFEKWQNDEIFSPCASFKPMTVDELVSSKDV